MAERKAYRLQMSPDLYSAVQDAAYNERISMNEFIAGTLAAATGHAGIIDRLLKSRTDVTFLGWAKVSRWGNLTNECPECGDEMEEDAAYVGLLSNGQHTQPVCISCAINNNADRTG